MIIINFAKSLLAGLTMGAVLFYIRDQVHILFSVGIGGLVYLMVMLLVKGITVKEIKELYVTLK